MFPNCFYLFLPLNLKKNLNHQLTDAYNGECYKFWQVPCGELANIWVYSNQHKFQVGARAADSNGGCCSSALHDSAGCQNLSRYEAFLSRDLSAYMETLISQIWEFDTKNWYKKRLYCLFKWTIPYFFFPF